MAKTVKDYMVIYKPTSKKNVPTIITPLGFVFQSSENMTVYKADEYLAMKQVFPVEDCQDRISQRLVEAAHVNDNKVAFECLADPFVDVNYVGTVCLSSKKTDIVLHDESATEVNVVLEEFKTNVTPLFLAAHAGNVALVRKLLTVGANVNKKLFRGYATTAAARGNHVEILELLLEGGASQLACEEALLEASHLGLAKSAKALMASELIRPNVAVHALVNASCRGYVDFVDTLLKCGVDMNGTARVLLRSSKPFLHADVSCNALVAATVNRHISIVRLLLQAGARTDTKVSLGAWSWGMTTGEEFRVGAGLAEPYTVTWCAVEYFEQTGTILNMLLQHISPNTPHFGKTIIHHAILCANLRAVEVLLKCGADPEIPVQTSKGTGSRLIHLAARLGYYDVLNHLVNARCNLDSKNELGETALMICARHKHVECLKLLARSGADFGLVNLVNKCVQSIAGSVKWTLGLRQVILDVVRSGKVVYSTDTSIFSCLMFVTRVNDIEGLKTLVDQRGLVDLNEQDENGYSAVMVAVINGYAEAFRLLVYAGADVNLRNKHGETAISLSEASVNSGEFEKIMLEYTLNSCNHGFYTLHHAVSRGDFDSVERLTNDENDVNSPNSDGYTPLMLAARGGHGKICEFLISKGAICDIENARHETALSLAREHGVGNDAEQVLLDHLARGVVLSGARVKKHCKGGKGCPHRKTLVMVEGSGLLRWGKSSRRNVVCKRAEVGTSSVFKWNRQKKGDADEPGLFRVVTTRNKEVHFVCEGGVEMAELWVRGIKLVTQEAIFGK